MSIWQLILFFILYSTGHILSTYILKRFSLKSVYILLVRSITIAMLHEIVSVFYYGYHLWQILVFIFLLCFNMILLFFFKEDPFFYIFGL